MPLHLNKPALRILGIAESFKRSDITSHLAGVVMRSDLMIDGFAFSRIKVGGEDATDGVFKIFKELNREDINVILLNGAIISWFNIIDLQAVFENLHIPLLCLTYEESPGIEKFIEKHFPNDKEKMQRYLRLGKREPIDLNTNYRVYARPIGLSLGEARILLNRLTFDGRVPEPLRVARLLARASLNTDKQDQ